MNGYGEKQDTVCSTVERFAMVDNGLYRGAQPDRVMLAALKQQGIRTIVNFRAEKNLVEQERQWAQELGLEYVSLPWTIYGPFRKEVFDRFFALLDDPAKRPIFFHCKRGSERTGVLAALYAIRYQGASYEEALAEARQYDIKAIWWPFVQRKIKQYLAATEQHS